MKTVDEKQQGKLSRSSTPPETMVDTVLAGINWQKAKEYLEMKTDDQ